MSKKIRVLIVDDSAVVRQTLVEILTSDPDIEVMATAADPLIAVERLRDDVPDVITLDVEMPRMDGLTFLKKVMTQHPIPIVMCSSLTVGGSETAIKAMEYGAVDIIEKPRMGAKQFLEEAKARICDVVKAAAMSRIRKAPPVILREGLIQPKLTADAVIEKGSSGAMIQTTDKVIIVGASTGGTETIRYFLESMPHDAPGIVIVQHMPEKFTEAFATRLDGLCRISVKEAADNDTVIRGRALIAPGNRHMLLKRSGARYYVEIKDGPLVCRHRPSVDVLFRSGARYAGKNAIGVIMTGMGDDGSRGMLEMMEAGAYTIAQDEESCVVFGMPKKAIELGAVKKILPLEKIHDAVLERARMF